MPFSVSCIYSGCEPRIPGKVIPITALAPNPWREDNEGNFSLRGWRETPNNESAENPRNQEGTENLFCLVHQAGIEPRTPGVKGEERLV